MLDGLVGNDGTVIVVNVTCNLLEKIQSGNIIKLAN